MYKWITQWSKGLREKLHCLGVEERNCLIRIRHGELDICMKYAALVYVDKITIASWHTEVELRAIYIKAIIKQESFVTFHFGAVASNVRIQVSVEVHCGGVKYRKIMKK